MKCVGVVEQIGSKNVTTKFGVKPTYSFKVGGEWFKTGFKNPVVAVGDSISFEYTPGKYGNDVELESLVVGTSVAALSLTTTSHAPATAIYAPTPMHAPVNSGVKSYRNGTFPIDPLDGQRSIIRQNALTNARELVQQTIKPGGVLTDVDATVVSILNIARKFEAYTSGDIEAEAAKTPATDSDVKRSSS
jgi:hypothetical protein